MRLRWSETAPDHKEISDYIDEKDGVVAARRIALRIYDALDSLALFPNKGRPGRRPGTRELVVTALPWIGDDRVREDVVEIDRILHGARNLHRTSLSLFACRARTNC